MNYNNDVGVVGDYIVSSGGSQLATFNQTFILFPAVGFCNNLIGSFKIPDDFDDKRNFTDTEKFITFTHWINYGPSNGGGLYALRIYKKGDPLWTNEYAYYTTGTPNEFITPISGYNGTTTSWNLEAGQEYEIYLMIAYNAWFLYDGAVEISFNYNTKPK